MPFCNGLRVSVQMVYIFHEKYSYYNALEVFMKHKLLFRTILLHYGMVSKRRVTKVKGCLPRSRSQTTLTRIGFFDHLPPCIFYDMNVDKSEHFKTKAVVVITDGQTILHNKTFIRSLGHMYYDVKFK